MTFDFSGLIVLFGFIAVFVALKVIKAQQEAKPQDQDWYTPFPRLFRRRQASASRRFCRPHLYAF